MREQFTAEDLRGQFDELLAIKYRHPKTPRVLEKLLGKREEYIVEMRIFDEPVVMRLRRDGYTVTIGTPERSDLRVTVPFSTMMKVLGGKMPIGDLFSGKIRFWGNPLAVRWLQRLLFVPVGDPRAAASYFYHYFVDDLE